MRDERRGSRDGRRAPSFEDLVRGYEDSPFMVLVAMWRTTGIGDFGPEDWVRAVLAGIAFWACLWVACAWAAL